MKKHNKYPWKDFDPGCVGKDGFYPLPIPPSDISLADIYEQERGLRETMSSAKDRYKERLALWLQESESWFYQILGEDPPKEAGAEYKSYLEQVRLRPGTWRETRHVLYQKIDDARKKGATMEEIRDLIRAHKPWPDFNPACKEYVWFYPMTPWGGDETIFNTEIQETRLRNAKAALDDPELSEMYKESRRRHIPALESHLAQLRGEPGAIPEEAGQGYRDWIKWLRSQDPANKENQSDG